MNSKNSIINGRAIADTLAEELSQEVVRLRANGIIPKLAIVVYQPDERSEVYIRLKQKRAQEIGIEVELHDWSDNEQDDCLQLMKELVARDDVHGIIVQLPISGWVDPQQLLDLIPPHKDVDGLSMASLQSLKDKSAQIVPATPLAVLRVLELSDISLSDKKIVIVGQGKLVGLPLNIILRNRGLDVTVADISTEDLAAATNQADVLITATGQPKLIDKSMIKAGVVLVDVGIVEVNGKLTGDVDYDSVGDTPSVIVPVPGGVGPVTVVCLLKNVVNAAAAK